MFSCVCKTKEIKHYYVLKASMLCFIIWTKNMDIKHCPSAERVHLPSMHRALYKRKRVKGARQEREEKIGRNMSRDGQGKKRRERSGERE